MYVPPEWPGAVRHPDVADWEVSAAAWLLDACPPDYRAHEVLRRHPVALALLARHHVQAQLAGARAAFRFLRELSPYEEPHTITAVQDVLRVEGPRLTALADAIAAVEHALRGGTFTEQLRPEAARRVSRPTGDPRLPEPRARFFPRS